MAQLRVEDFFNPPQDSSSKFLTGRFSNRQDLNLHTYAWLPMEGKPIASVFVFHDFGEHAGRYRRLAHELNRLGFAVFSLDLQGHGRSAGRRGYVGRYEDYVRDACDFISKVPGVYLQLPKFLLGSGMGATIINMAATLTHTRRPNFFAGLIFLSPAVKGGLSFASRSVVRRASLFGRKVRTSDPQFLSRDPEVVSNYRTDTLVFHSKVKSSTALQLLKAMAWLASERSVGKMSFPFLVCQGSADQVVCPTAAKQFYDDAPSQDKELRFYDGYYHDLLHEKGFEQVQEDIASWIAARVAATDFAPIPPEAQTPRFFPEAKDGKASLDGRRSSINERREAEALDDFAAGTAPPSSPVFMRGRSMSLEDPAFGSSSSIGEDGAEEFDMTDDECAEPIISPRTLDILVSRSGRK